MIQLKYSHLGVSERRLGMVNKTPLFEGLEQQYHETTWKQKYFVKKSLQDQVQEMDLNLTLLFEYTFVQLR